MGRIKGERKDWRGNGVLFLGRPELTVISVSSWETLILPSGTGLWSGSSHTMEVPCRAGNTTARLRDRGLVVELRGRALDQHVRGAGSIPSTGARKSRLILVFTMLTGQITS